MTLTIDDREVTEHPELREGLSIPVVVQRLGSADYAFLDVKEEAVGIERCEIGNFIQKIRNGELEAQLTRCDEDYNRVILLLEGVYDHVGNFLSHYKKTREGNAYYRSRIEPNTRYSEIKALQVRLSELGIEVLETPNFECSMRLIETIYVQRTKPEDQHTFFRKTRALKIPVKNTANPTVPRLMALCPRMQEKTAILMVNRFDTLWNIFHAEDKDLLEVEGFGKTGLSNLKRSIGRNAEV